MHVYIGPYGPTDMCIHAPILYTANDGNNKQIQPTATLKTATSKKSMAIGRTGTLYPHQSEQVDNHNQQRTPEEGPQSKRCQHQVTKGSTSPNPPRKPDTPGASTTGREAPHAQEHPPPDHTHIYTSSDLIGISLEKTT